MPIIRLATPIDAPPETCFDLAIDVDVHIAASGRETIVGGISQGMMGLDDEVTWRSVRFGIPWKMTSKIIEYQRPTKFVDEMVRGPFARWRHEHSFEMAGNGTVLNDLITYASPLGLIGVITDQIFMKRYMTQLLLIQNRHIKKVAEGRSS